MPFSRKTTEIVASAGNSSGPPPKSSVLTFSSKTAVAPSKDCEDFVVRLSVLRLPPQDTMTVSMTRFLVDSKPHPDTAADTHFTSRSPCRRTKWYGSLYGGPIGNSQGEELRHRAKTMASDNENRGCTSLMPCTVERTACGEPNNGPPADTQESTCWSSHAWPLWTFAYSKKYLMVLLPMEWPSRTTPVPLWFNFSTFPSICSKNWSRLCSSPGAKRQSYVAASKSRPAT
mmetsp:Transcript_80973/g.234723  ORF Transcript_80973/g.234723 Transcript_80973/m.234723 type:complete len:230 (-) Transcript_80973:334-1023(-)